MTATRGSEDRTQPAPSRDQIAWDDEEAGYSLLPFVLQEPLTWRATDEEGWFELHIPTQDRWKRIEDHWVPVLEALDQGLPLPEVHRHAAEAMPERPRSHIRYIVRKVTSYLTRRGIAEVVIPEIPEVFADRYQVLDELGRGGMGIVWLTRDLDHPDEREVVVKHAWNWRGSLSGRDQGLRKEGAMMAKADHPGIIAFFDDFEVDGRYHLVREYLEGPGLSSVDVDELSVEDRARLLSQMVDGLIHLRELGYLCLDLKTGNYMLDGEGGSVKLVDLGLCAPLEDGRVRARGFPGTRAYQDPILLEEDLATEQTSVYALGRILWQLVTGKAPRPRAHYESYFEQHAEDIERFRRTAASQAEQALYEAACSPDPEDRPPTLEAFRDRLP